MHIKKNSKPGLVENAHKSVCTECNTLLYRWVACSSSCCPELTVTFCVNIVRLNCTSQTPNGWYSNNIIWCLFFCGSSGQPPKITWFHLGGFSPPGKWETWICQECGLDLLCIYHVSVEYFPFVIGLFSTLSPFSKSAMRINKMGSLH